MATSLTANLILQKTKLDHLRHVRRLNVCGAQVSHIHVLRDAINVEVLSLSVNQIEDLSPLSFLEELRELYLRKNKISDLMQVLHLSQLEQLTVLGMSENPISDDPSYRPFVIAAIPTLWKLDDIEITPTERREAEAEFSEVRHWAPPDPIPMSQIGGASPQSNVSSPRRARNTKGGESEERDPLANTYGGGAHTARRKHHAHHHSHHHNEINVSEEDDPYRRVPATARRPSANVHNTTNRSHQQIVSDPIPSSASEGNGWDDVPVGGGGARKRPSAANLAVNRGGASASMPVHQPRMEGDQKASVPPSSTSPSSSSSVRPPPIKLATAASSRYSDPNMAFEEQSEQSVPTTLRTEARSTHLERANVPRGDLLNNPSSSPSTTASQMEEGVVRAIKMLVDQLSPAGLDEIYNYTNSKRSFHQHRR